MVKKITCLIIIFGSCAAQLDASLKRKLCETIDDRHAELATTAPAASTCASENNTSTSQNKRQSQLLAVTGLLPELQDIICGYVTQATLQAPWEQVGKHNTSQDYEGILALTEEQINQKKEITVEDRANCHPSRWIGKPGKSISGFNVYSPDDTWVAECCLKTIKLRTSTVGWGEREPIQQELQLPTEDNIIFFTRDVKYILAICRPQKFVTANEINHADAEQRKLYYYGLSIWKNMLPLFAYKQADTPAHVEKVTTALEK